jgi:hypothetical protein
MSLQGAPRQEIDSDRLREIVRKSITSDLPPAGFDPLTASQNELQKLGFPMRPDPARRPAAYAAWRTMFAGPVVFEAFDFVIANFRTTARRAFFAQLAPLETSLNWSGAYITPRDGTIFSELWGRYQVPTPNLPPGGSPDDKYWCSTWIGFDGQRRYRDSTLPQIGTAQNIDPAGGVPVRSYFAWWQWWVRNIPSVPMPLTAPAIHPGDLIALFMQVAGDRKAVAFAIRNLTTNRAVQFTQAAPWDPAVGRQFKVSGATAEWVTERAADPPDPTPLQLPDYGTVDFHECGATAVNMDTAATVERSLSAPRLIDMYVVEKKPERTVNVSIARSTGTTNEVLTYYQQ